MPLEMTHKKKINKAKRKTYCESVLAHFWPIKMTSTGLNVLQKQFFFG